MPANAISSRQDRLGGALGYGDLRDARLGHFDPMNSDDLEQSSLFGERRLQEILAAMEQNGLIEREGDLGYRLTEEGARRRRSVMKHDTDLANA